MAEIRCRYCGDTRERKSNSRDEFSHWSHVHPSVCPYREDKMPSLNGVHVGDVWRNVHSGHELVVTEIRLGGAGTYCDREPIVLGGENDMLGWPLWALVEHWEPVTRPGEYPVPWRKEKGQRVALDAWRTPAYRGSTRKRRKPAYFHAYHTVNGHSIEWNGTNDIWQFDQKKEDVKLAETIRSRTEELEAQGMSKLDAKLTVAQEFLGS